MKSCHILIYNLCWWWVGGGWCTYDYNVSLSPNLWIMTLDLDLDLTNIVNLNRTWWTFLTLNGSPRDIFINENLRNKSKFRFHQSYHLLIKCEIMWTIINYNWRTTLITNLRTLLDVKSLLQLKILRYEGNISNGILKLLIMIWYLYALVITASYAGELRYFYINPGVTAPLGDLELW